jgi:hypothetical protein
MRSPALSAGDASARNVGLDPTCDNKKNVKSAGKYVIFPRDMCGFRHPMCGFNSLLLVSRLRLRVRKITP